MFIRRLFLDIKFLGVNKKVDFGEERMYLHREIAKYYTPFFEIF